MPSSLSEIDAEVSDDDSDQEVDQLAEDPDAHQLEDKESDGNDPDDENMDDKENMDDQDSDDDSMDGELGRCEHCSLPLGHNTRKPSRVFRCGACESDLQCEKCCHSIHMCKPDHPLQEWDSTADYGANAWFNTRFKQTGLISAHATRCGVCKTVVAPEARKIPWWVLLCEECGCGVMCQSCCFKKHKSAPLHRVKHWSGKCWETTTLREHGFVYQMGHGGETCPHPDKFVSSLLVIALTGVVRIHLKYCRCPDSEGMARSNWEQIRQNGWFPATLDHPGVCCTFEVPAALAAMRR
ncbi:hypothetical protein B0H11DRAFT_2262791 [Mycena galericulata]|nr:hypothetical protein B0H11DRAFT_2262791 [Mycena galericulata]